MQERRCRTTPSSESGHLSRHRPMGIDVIVVTSALKECDGALFGAVRFVWISSV